MSKHADGDVVTWGDLRKVIKIVKRLDERIGEAFEAITKGDERIGEAFEAITKGDDAQAQFWDEHEDKIARLKRELNRHERNHD